MMDMSSIEKSNEQYNTKIPVNFGIITVSDTRNKTTDKSGKYLVNAVKAAGHYIESYHIIKDEKLEITALVKNLTQDGKHDAIITTGGTGLTRRDITVDAVKPLFEKNIDGFSYIFHHISFQKIGTSTIQSRVCAGIINGCFIFCLPGSPSACKDGWEKILKSQFDNTHKPCNFIEIMPRMQEDKK